MLKPFFFLAFLSACTTTSAESESESEYIQISEADSMRLQIASLDNRLGEVSDQLSSVREICIFNRHHLLELERAIAPTKSTAKKVKAKRK